MEFRILGPLEVVSEQTLLDLGAPRVRLLLALLLVRGGEVVSTDRLIEDLWDGDPPATGRHTMQGCVYRLRQALGVDAWRLATRPPGYQLKASADELDARRFQELAQQGRDALAGGRSAVAAGLLQEALGLWRGSALADLLDSSALAGERARLEGMRLTVLEDRVEADLAVGRLAGLVAELERLVAEHPFRERLWGS
jgi:DNA-binding SARP family transcriptional activator